MNDNAFQIKVSLSKKIMESILAVILVSSRYENKFLSLSLYSKSSSSSEIWLSRNETKVSPCIFLCPDSKKKKKKKKKTTYRPSQFSGQKGKQTFIS